MLSNILKVKKNIDTYDSNNIRPFSFNILQRFVHKKERDVFSKRVKMKNGQRGKE